MAKVLDIQVKQKVKVMNDNPTAWDHIKTIYENLKPTMERVKNYAMSIQPGLSMKVLHEQPIDAETGEPVKIPETVEEYKQHIKDIQE